MQKRPYLIHDEVPHLVPQALREIVDLDRYVAKRQPQAHTGSLEKFFKKSTKIRNLRPQSYLTESPHPYYLSIPGVPKLRTLRQPSLSQDPKLRTLRQPSLSQDRYSTQLTTLRLEDSSPTETSSPDCRKSHRKP